MVTMDANECTIAKIGAEIEVIWHKESHVIRKQRSGGQSASRFMRGREMELIQWLKEVADKVCETSGGSNIVLAGPGETHQKLTKYLSTPVTQRVVGWVDVGYTSEQGIEEAIDKAQDLLKGVKSAEDKKLGDEFARMLAKTPELTDYGPNFDRTNVKLILVPEEHPDLQAFPIKVIEHPVVRALGICVFKKYATH
jgi:peptide subunit release factor 1 (eRF1)